MSRTPLTVAAVLLASCKGAPSDSSDEGVHPTGCLYDFEVNITEGTGAGTTLLGPLSLLHVGRAVAGFYTPEGAGRMGFFGEVKDGLLYLNFPHEGGIIRGVGPAPTDLDACDGEDIVGDLLGPYADSAGDWRGTLSLSGSPEVTVDRCSCVEVYLDADAQANCTLVCDAYRDFVDPNVDYDACFDSCLGTEASITCGGGQTSFFNTCQ